VLSALGALLGSVAIQAVVRLDVNDDRRVARVLIVLQCGWVLSVFVFGLSSSFVVAAVAFWCKRVVDYMSEPCSTPGRLA